MQSKVDTTFQTVQRDLFASGMAAKIGMNAYGLWSAIKNHADFETGECWPGMRRLAELTALSLGTVSTCVQTLVDAKLLRVVSEGNRKKANVYIARERIDVRLGNRVLCTIVIDYVPRHLRERLEEIENAILTNKGGADAFAQCEIIPGEGFHWDAELGALRASIPVTDVPADLPDERDQTPLVRKMLDLQRRALPGDNSKEQ